MERVSGVAGLVILQCSVAVTVGQSEISVNRVLYAGHICMFLLLSVFSPPSVIYLEICFIIKVLLAFKSISPFPPNG